MKALTLTQPWATLVAIGAKRFETRSWSTSYRGPLLIHAAAGFAGAGGKIAAENFCHLETVRAALLEIGERQGETRFWSFDMLPLGAVLAVCELAYCLPAHEIEDDLVRDADYRELDFGNFAPGRSAWRLANVRRLDEPIPWSGALGLWNVPGELAAAVDRGTVLAW